MNQIINSTVGAFEYLPGEYLNITGAVSPIINGPVSVLISNPSGGIWLKDDINPDEDGNFTISELVWPGDQVGNYSVRASYYGVTNSTTFVIGQFGSSTFRLSNLGVYDTNGNSVFMFDSGSMVEVKATLNNMDVVSHDLLFIIQIKNSDGKIVYSGSQQSSLESNDFITLSIGQAFLYRDIYSVDVLVWDQWLNSNILSEEFILNFRII
jgi:hypothetical protein